MNELNFHTKILINPYELDEELLCYLQENPEKKHLLKKAREFDQGISQALDIDIPEGLHARILLNQSYQQFTLSNEPPEVPPLLSAAKQQAAHAVPFAQGLSGQSTQHPNQIESFTRSHMSWPSLALVASLLLLSVLLVLKPMTPANIHGEQFVEHILAHIKADPELMADHQIPQNRPDLQNLFASVGASLHQPLQGMSYAGICEVGGLKGLHLVVQQMGEPVTIIVMPGMQTDSEKAFQASGMHGELVPFKDGLIAIIGNNMQQVAMAEAYFFKAVRFA